MQFVLQLPTGISLVQACEAVGLPRASFYRLARPYEPRVKKKRIPPRKLSDTEMKLLKELLHAAEFVDQPPREIYAKLLSRGVYMASIRTMYRLLASLEESQERRCQRVLTKHEKPVLVACSPNQVWNWDITKLASEHKGVFYCLYVVIDLYSRYVVGWMVAERETATLSTQLMKDLMAREGIEPGQLTSHSDRGSPMKSTTWPSSWPALVFFKHIVDLA